MAEPGTRKEVRIFENCHELSNALAEYIADLCEQAARERGAFAIALSGGSLIGLLGYLITTTFLLSFFLCGFCLNSWWATGSFVKVRLYRLWSGVNGTFFGRMNIWWPKLMLIAIIGLQETVFCPRLVNFFSLNQDIAVRV